MAVQTQVYMVKVYPYGGNVCQHDNMPYNSLKKFQGWSQGTHLNVPVLRVGVVQRIMADWNQSSQNWRLNLYLTDKSHSKSEKITGH